MKSDEGKRRKRTEQEETRGKSKKSRGNSM